MAGRKRGCVLVLLTSLVLALTCFLGERISWAGAQGIQLKIGETQAWVGGEPLHLPVAPVVRQGTTLVPVRLIAEAFGARVGWNEEQQQVVITVDARRFVWQIGSSIVLADGEPRELAAAPELVQGTALVPLRFLVESLEGEIAYLADTGEVVVKPRPQPAPPPPPNRPPVTSFQVSKAIVAQGETVTYIDTSYDPDGDPIVVREWYGNRRAFFAPGEYRVTLRVQDGRGAWSQAVGLNITVTEEVLYDEVTYNILHPLPGEMFSVASLDLASLAEKSLLPSGYLAGGPTLLFSDSPEYIEEKGIFYQDTVSGPVRLYYYHVNASPTPKKVYLLATNPGLQPVTFTWQKKGTAGPSPDFYAVGRSALERYLPSEERWVVTVPPRETVVLNPESPAARPGQCVHGIFDGVASAPIIFSFVAVDAADRVLEVFPSLPFLPPDAHVRGTFLQADRSFAVNLEEGSLLLADGVRDYHLSGRDALTGRMVTNRGNYGMLYRVQFRAPEDKAMGVILTSPAGGFAGAFTFNGVAYTAPRTGILRTRDQGVLLGTLAAGETGELLLMPPAASWLPVRLLFVEIPEGVR